MKDGDATHNAYAGDNPDDKGQRGRPRRSAAPVEHVEVDEAKFAGAMVTMREQAVDEQTAIYQNVFRLGQQVGAIQLAKVQTSFLRGAEIRLFAKMRESKDFKRIPIPLDDGTAVTAKTIEEFSRLVFRSSYSKMAEEQQNFETLGEQAYDAAHGLGLTRDQMRLIRMLPKAEQIQVREVLESEDRVNVTTLIEDLVANIVEKDTALNDAKADLAAKDELLAKKNELLDKERTKNRRFAKAPPDEKLADLHRQATSTSLDALGCVRGAMRHALRALAAAEDEHGDQHLFMAGLLGPVQAELNTLRSEFGLVDLAAAGDAELAREVDQWWTDGGSKDTAAAVATPHED